MLSVRLLRLILSDGLRKVRPPELKRMSHDVPTLPRLNPYEQADCPRPQATASSPQGFRIFGVALRGAEIVESPASEDAKRRLRTSWIFTAAGPLAILMLLVTNGVGWTFSLKFAGMSVYVVWAWYWGFIALMNFLTGSDKRVEAATDLTTAFSGPAAVIFGIDSGIAFIAVVALGILLGVVYGTLGGGIREFLKYRSMARNPGLQME